MLKVWLPLNGDLHNQGISGANITSANSSVIANGKIGSCMKITAQTDLQYIPNFNTTGLSLCGWFKFNQSELATVLDTLTYTSTANSPTGNLLGNTSYGGIGLIWIGNNHYNSGNFSAITAYATLRTPSVNQTTTGASIEFDTWIHLTLTWDPITHILSLYKNGNLINSKTFTAFTNGVARTLYLNYKAVYGGNGPSANIPLYCNDIRIYDHCLSAAEVKEIAQGLVLHYKLDNNGQGGRNLMRKGTGTFHNTDKLTTITWSGWDSYNSLSLTDIDWNNHYGDYITYSCYMENVEQTAGTGSGIMLHFRYADGTYQQFGGGKNGTSGQYLAQGESGWLRLTVAIPNASTRSNPTTIARVEASVRHNSSGGASTIRYQYPQVEYGNKQTVWSWAPEDIGDDPARIEDSSGYNHNGSILNNVLISSDTPRYSTSTNLVAGNSAINCGRGGMVTDSITVNLWLKSSAWNNPVSCTEGGGWNFESSGNGFRFPVYLAGVGYKATGVTTTTRAQLCNNQWHMITGVYDRLNQKIRVYIDANLEYEENTSSSALIGYHGSNVIWIGAEASGSATAIGSNGMAGLFSDFRIYCTPLLDTDIKQLYNVGMKIDKLGSVHSFEFIEQQSNMIFPIELSRSNLEFTNGLSRYTQSNCQVTLTDQGYHIYRPPNLTTANDGNTMWGGLKLINQKTDTIAAYDSSRDNNWGLQKGHTYFAAFHAKGKSSNSTSWGWANNMGWSGGGVNASPTIITNIGIPSDFQGEKDCIFIFTINDDIAKNCTSAYYSYVANTTYLSYRHLTFGWSYSSTGTLGTDLYLTDLRLYDITNYMAKITKQGQAKFYDFVEQLNKAQIRRKSEFLSSNFIER